MRTILCVLLAMMFSSANAALPSPQNTREVDLDSLYRQLDQAIRQSPTFVAEKEETIGRLMEKLRESTHGNTQLRCLHDLYDEYFAFCNDSAIYYLEQCVTLAEQLGNKTFAGECRAELAFQCSNTGMFDESLFILDNIDMGVLDGSGLTAYYRARNHVYSEMAFYTRFDALRQRYRSEALKYEQLLLAQADGSDVRALQRREMTLMDQGQNDASLAINDQWMKQVTAGSHPYALTTFYRYLEYKNRNDSVEMMHWLAESALADVRNAVMDQGSMWELANLLMGQGDIDRAYNYISFASDCATRFGTRLRFWQISPIITAIDTKYRQVHLHDKQRMRIIMGILGVLAAVLAFTLYDLLRQHRKLRSAHAQVHEQNSQLSALNAQLSTLNSKLSTHNTQLATANSVKEEYVGHFMRLCSMYIDKLDNFRRRVNRMVKNHEFEDLYQLTRSQEFRDKELEDLYVSFDTAFLHLFPNFVNDFNALLKPEERITVEEKNRLNTSIRIFALIRLGIDDSSKIAEFLHYSVNTIYNYRARIKNGALDDRENFEQHVREIGMPT